MIARSEGASGGSGFSTRPVTRTTSPSGRRVDGRAAVHVDLLVRHLHQRHDPAAVLLLDLEHLLQQRVARVDQVVAEQDGEGLVADVALRAQHGVPEAARVALAHVVHVAERWTPGPGQPLLVALVLQRQLQLEVAVEVVLQGALVAAGDHQDVVEAGRDGLLDDVLDRRLVDDRQHLLGSGLGGGQEPGAEACRGDDSLADGVAGSCPQAIRVAPWPTLARWPTRTREHVAAAKKALRQRLRRARGSGRERPRAPPGSSTGSATAARPCADAARRAHGHGARLRVRARRARPRAAATRLRATGYGCCCRSWPAGDLDWAPDTGRLRLGAGAARRLRLLEPDPAGAVRTADLASRRRRRRARPALAAGARDAARAGRRLLRPGAGRLPPHPDGPLVVAWCTTTSCWRPARCRRRRTTARSTPC